MKNERSDYWLKKTFYYWIAVLLVLFGFLTCTKDSLVPFSTKKEAIITDYHALYVDSVQVLLQSSSCIDNSFNLGITYFDKQFDKMHSLRVIYYGYEKQNPPVNGRSFCTELTPEQKRKFTPFISGAGYYEEDDVASTFYSLDTNKVYAFDVNFDDRFLHKINFDLNLIKTIGPGRSSLGPGIDSFHIIAPEFAAKVWFWH